MTRSKLALALALSTALTSFSVAANAEGFEAGSILVRARALGVISEDSSNKIKLNTSTEVGGVVSANATAIPEVDLTYFLTKNIGIEAIAGMSRNAVSTSGNTLGLASPTRLGTSWILPPTITAAYHFDPIAGFSPYLGAGINYTIFFDTQSSTWLGSTKFHLSDTVGAALQAGVDYNITGSWYLNVDVKKIFLTTKAKFATNTSTVVTSDVQLDPWLVGAGIGYRF
jgi:outer membrane protein